MKNFQRFGTFSKQANRSLMLPHGSVARLVLRLSRHCWAQLWAFSLFRFFDAAKPGPVAWADAAFKGQRGQPIGWAQGFGIIFDDLVAALCTLLVIALWRFV